ncbi:HlyB family type I secretion system ABC transporter [Thermosporothrix hazakensis]|jgi:HlyB family type I secretion system ABC transporter|uniref:HlyB family type I secretion system ABC transporter n=2 Tax=Thermosporothrix TaxID=768650 RepID=A0A326U6J6_THEHA|nr:peptidase domain-containing ABC transporter [Thermosporothrix hazakensis]PZW29566.1 HlyB family type I secretion system ABC transporter [Thermosporothrix hazakensis]BBH85853.1 NHLP family bacteriocin export ABC transporter peptidase/permease/ATPase [Thermosporothrix sp. COM3]GCE45720.1 NHLP family bacteriocin export ABC transporter peptidase/permease/ATPase [Thermosporothrix hazakensis]
METKQQQKLTLPPPAKSSENPDIWQLDTVPIEQVQVRPRPFLARLWGQFFKKRVPVLIQMTEVECGLACLAMLLSYHGRKTSISELRTQFGIGRDGLSALSIVQAARGFGLQVKPVAMKRSDFSRLPLPAIIHWQFNHYLIVERWTPKYAVVIDPASGRKKMSLQELNEGFTGIAILAEPGPRFKRRKTSPGTPILATFLWKTLKRSPGAVLQVLAASALLQVFGLLLPLLTKLVTDYVLPTRTPEIMSIIGVGVMLLLLVQAITTLLRGWVIVYLRVRIDMNIMFSFFEHLLSLPYNFFQQRSNGDLLSRIESNSVIRDTLTNPFVSALLDSVMVITYMLILLWQSPTFAAIALLMGALQATLMISTYNHIRGMANRELSAQGKAQGYMSEVLAGIATIKSSGTEQRAHERWSNLFLDQLNVLIQRSYIQTLIDTGMNLLRTTTPLLLLCVGAFLVLNGSMTIGTMLAMNSLAAAFLSPLTSLISSGQQLQLVHAHFERLADVIAAEPEQYNQQVISPPELTGHVQLRNVSFRYGPDSPWVLKNINLVIEPGQQVAIVGRTGSGKSTLGKLLLGLYIPSSGKIQLDGIPIDLMRYSEVRRQFGVVLQEASIFSGSIMHNITFDDSSISKEQAMKAAQIAAFHEDIVQMPMGYDTMVAEGGSALSGGQRQRLALARAIVRNPRILLLDEATSSLDAITEQRITENLQGLSCTQIIIAHRLSTIRSADMIVVLDQGSIVEKGTHEELMKKGGYYAELLKQQFEKQQKQTS